MGENESPKRFCWLVQSGEPPLSARRAFNTASSCTYLQLRREISFSPAFIPPPASSYPLTDVLPFDLLSCHLLLPFFHGQHDNEIPRVTSFRRHARFPPLVNVGWYSPLLSSTHVSLASSMSCRLARSIPLRYLCRLIQLALLFWPYSPTFSSLSFPPYQLASNSFASFEMVSSLPVYYPFVSLSLMSDRISVRSRW